MSRILIKEGRLKVIKTANKTQIKQGVFYGHEHYFAIISRDLFISDKVNEAFNNLIKAIEEDNKENENE